MTNQKKLADLYLNIDSKAFLFFTAFYGGIGSILSEEERTRFLKMNKPSRINKDIIYDAFRQHCLDYNLIDIVDGEDIDYCTLLLYPDKEYRPSKVKIINENIT